MGIHFSRRNFMKASTLAAASPAIALAPLASDPLLAAIKRYEAAWERFSSLPDGVEADNHHLWKVPWQALADWDQPCMTREGAIAALRLAVAEDEIGDSPIPHAMTKSALAFLEGNKA